jgi:hypothetical protein
MAPGIVRAAPSCSTEKYMKAGSDQDRASEKIYRFQLLQNDLEHALQVGAGPEAKCLSDFYQKALSEEGDYWGRRMAEEKCEIKDPSSCKDTEVARSVHYLTSLNEHFIHKIKNEEIYLIKPLCQQPATLSVEQLHNQMCCGSPDGKSVGAVRAILKGINYNSCLDKISTPRNQTDWQKLGRAPEVLSSCVGDVVAGLIKGVWDSMTSMAKLPVQLWAARNEIWLLMTNTSARKKFSDALSNAVQQFVANFQKATNSCLNPAERVELACHMAGEIFGAIRLAPMAITKILSIASSPLSKGASLIAQALDQTPKGQALLRQMQAANNVASSAMTAARATTNTALNSAKNTFAGFTGASAQITKSLVDSGNTFLNSLKSSFTKASSANSKINASDLTEVASSASEQAASSGPANQVHQPAPAPPSTSTSALSGYQSRVDSSEVARLRSSATQEQATFEKALSSPVDRIRNGDAKLFQGETPVPSRPQQVFRYEQRIAKREASGGTEAAEAFVAGERKRLQDLLKKYSEQESKISGEAPDVARAARRKLSANREIAREQLSSLEAAAKKSQYRRWEANEPQEETPVAPPPEVTKPAFLGNLKPSELTPTQRQAADFVSQKLTELPLPDKQEIFESLSAGRQYIPQKAIPTYVQHMDFTDTNSLVEQLKPMRLFKNSKYTDVIFFRKWGFSDPTSTTLQLPNLNEGENIPLSPGEITSIKNVLTNGGSVRISRPPPSPEFLAQTARVQAIPFKNAAELPQQLEQAGLTKTTLGANDIYTDPTNGAKIALPRATKETTLRDLTPDEVAGVRNALSNGGVFQITRPIVKPTIASKTAQALGRAPQVQPLPDEVILTPAMLKKTENVAQGIRQLNFEKTSAEQDKLVKRLLANVSNKRYKKTLDAVYQRLTDKNAWADYTAQLMKDAAKKMMSSRDPHAVTLAKTGTVTRNAILKVLVERARARGTDRFYSLEKSTGADGQPRSFFSVVQKGPFFDSKYFGGGHGVDTHLIQQDFVAPVVQQNLGAKNTQKLYQFLGTKKGKPLWDEVFDSGADNPTRPEYLKPVLLKDVPVK